MKLCVVGAENSIEGLLQNWPAPDEAKHGGTTCHTLLLLFLGNKIISTIKMCHHLKRVQCVQLAHDCDKENRHCTEKQCLLSEVDSMRVFVT